MASWDEARLDRQETLSQQHVTRSDGLESLLQSCSNRIALLHSSQGSSSRNTDLPTTAQTADPATIHQVAAERAEAIAMSLSNATANLSERLDDCEKQIQHQRQSELQFAKRLVGASFSSAAKSLVGLHTALPQSG